MNMKTPKLLICGIAASFIFSGCATDDFGNRKPLTDTQKGAAIGAASGAVLGALVSDKKGKGALIGAIGGGIAGGLVGNYMDKQKQDLEKALAPERNAGVITVEKFANHSIRVTMTGQTSFEVDSAEIKPGFISTMDKIGTVVKRYEKTTLTIIGHTDNTGSDAHNQSLSERRAQSVQDYFLQGGIHPTRLTAIGRGESEPRASNATESGRQLNRRVEILVEPVIAE
jgi:outer membrane protein OmpA-like peptidoglycan-associated protein